MEAESPTVQPYTPIIADILSLLNILWNTHQFTAESLMQQISSQVYKRTVRTILDNMVLQELVYQRVENEEGAFESDDQYGPNTSVVATYDIPSTELQVIVFFDNIAQLMGVDIGYDIHGISLYNIHIKTELKELCNQDAVLHAFFLYACDTFKKIHNLPINSICAVPECIYFKSRLTPFCCKECLVSKINIKCIKLREQGVRCICKMCIMLRQL
jgi:hypothetical protein